MNKTWFNVETENIEVPVDELFSAIDKGIEKGRRKKKNKKKSKLAVSIISIAASLLLVSGFLFSPMAKVLACVPVIGSMYESIYQSLYIKMGKELAAKNLVTEINQTASDKGITITLTSVYYDGIYIGVTFKAKGKPLDHYVPLGERGVELMDYSDYECVQYDRQGHNIMKGDGVLRKVDDYYMSAFELEQNPYKKNLPKDFTLPLTFKNIGGINGNWHFEIPVKQLPLKTLTFENSTSQDKTHSFTLKSMEIGKSNLRLYYKTNIGMDNLYFRVIDDKGNNLTENIFMVGDDMAIFHTGIGDTKYLMIYPQFKGYLKYIDMEPIMVKVQEN